MTSVAEYLRKITARAAFSWPAFWVFFALNVLGTFLGRLETAPQWWQRLIAVGLAQVAVFAIVGFGSLVERRIRGHLTRGILAIFWFALAGLVRGVVVGAMFAAMDVTDEPFYWARLAGGVGAGITALVLMSFVVGEARQSARIAAELLERQEQLALTAERVTAEIDVLEDDAMNGVRTRIVDALSQAGATGSPEQIERVATDIVRPLSHEWARATPTWRVPQVSSQGDRVRWPSVVTRMTAGAPFLPITTVVVIGVFSISNYVVRLGLLGAVLSIAVLVVVGTVTLRVVNRILVRVLPGLSIPVRVGLTLLTALVAGLVVGAIVGLFATVLFSADDRFEQRIVTSLVLLIPIFGIPLGLGRAVVLQLRSNVMELRKTDAVLAREVSRLCMYQWSTQRVLARALHGPAQSMIAASVAQVGNGGDPHIIVRELQRQLSAELDPHHMRASETSWRDALHRVEGTWQGLCAIDTTIDHAAEQLLDADAIGATIALEVVAEAVSNAVRHGKAAAVQIQMRIDDDGFLAITIDNEGIAGQGGETGLGSQMLQDCAVQWRRERRANGMTLHVSLNLVSEPPTTT